VIAERTAGEVSARCHDEQANLLALNLTNDVVTGAKTVAEARRSGRSPAAAGAAGLVVA
jgi:hypothetical protein